MSKVRLINGFLCDDIRREGNGKLIAIGIYTSKIVTGTFPGGLVLNALVNAVFYEIGDTTFKIRLTADGEVRSEVVVGATVGRVGPDWIPIPLGFVTFDKPSIIALSSEASGNKWKVFHEIRIELGPMDIELGPMDIVA